MRSFRRRARQSRDFRTWSPPRLGRRSAQLRVNPVASPDEHERVQHYLQRFWRRLPEHGQIVVFDRSWYGRVLVERIEGFATETEWRRAYREIDQLERILVDSGIRLVRLFLHITRDEQLRRFRNRLIDPVNAGTCPTRTSAIAVTGRSMN